MGEEGGGASKLLDVARESEMLRSFVRVNDDPVSPEKDESKPAAPETLAPEEGQDSRAPSRLRRRKKKNKKGEGLEGWESPPPAGPSNFNELSKELRAREKKQEDKTFRYLRSKDKKAKNKEKVVEEIYTDKDRAAAVNMGSRDIKQSLRLKRRLERSRALHIPEETEPSTLVALGKHEFRIGNTTIAIGFFNKALELSPQDKNALVERSKCHLLLGDPHQALEDAEHALSVDRTFIKALFQKAEALYHLGDFEHSLMYYHKGLRIRPEMEMFRLGVQKAQEAIENVIGNNKDVFPTSPRLLRKLLEKCSLSEQPMERPPTRASDRSATPKFSKVQPSSQAVKRATANERHFLGALYQDKKYLEGLLNCPEIISLNQEFSNNDIIKQAEEGITYLENRQEFWRQQKPSTSKGRRISSKAIDLKNKKKSLC